MAQALSATALSHERAFELARADRAQARRARRAARSTWPRCTTLAEDVLRAEEGDTAACALPALEAAGPARSPARGADRRHHRSRQVHARQHAGRPPGREPGDRHRRDPPGAARLLHPRGDADRARLRLRGGRHRRLPRPGRAGRHRHRRDRRAGRRARASRWSWRGFTWCRAAFTRACASAASWSRRCVVVDDPDLHRGHFSLRPGSRPAERYLAHFEEIRRLQDHLWERARSESVAIIDNANVDDDARAADGAGAGRGQGGPADCRAAAPLARVSRPMTVLQRKELESSPLADLHAIASELGLEGFRSKRKADLIGAILAAQGGEEDEPPAAEEPPAPVADEPEPDEVPSDEALEAPAERGARRARGGRARRSSRRSRRWWRRSPTRRSSPAGSTSSPTASGFLRMRPGRAVARRRVRVARPDPALRAALRRRDQRAGAPAAAQRAPPVAGPRRDRQRRRRRAARAAPLVRRADRRSSRSERLAAPDAFEAAPYGKGSRVAIVGPPGRRRHHPAARGGPEARRGPLRRLRAGRARRRAARGGGRVERASGCRSPAAASSARPRLRPRRPSWRSSAPSARSSAAATRPSSSTPSTRCRPARAAASSAPARATEEGGTLTVLAAGGEDRELLRWATTRVVLQRGRAGVRRGERSSPRRPALLAPT